MFEFPLIRFENKNWLENLQNGEFFMRTNLYYQIIEINDLARGDQFDGALPFPDECHVFESTTGNSVLNPRLVEPNIFIKCFYHCSLDDFIQVNNYLWKLSLSDNAKKEMQRFHSDSALLIFSPCKFIEQVNKAFCSKNEPVYYSDVTYLSDEQYSEITGSIILNPEKRKLLSFYKHERFSGQKEFRICVRHLLDSIIDCGQFLDIPQNAICQSYKWNIGKIEDSCIVSIANLFSNGILYDERNNQYYICEE